MINEIKIPQLGVNDDFAYLSDWYVEDKQKVEQGENLCTIETSKAVEDIQAEKDGYIHLEVEEGEKIPIGERIGWIVDSLDVDVEEYISKESKEEEERIREKVKEKSTKTSLQVTEEARKMARVHGLDVGSISSTGVIRKKDVGNYIKEKTEIPFQDSDTKKVAIYGAGAGGQTLKEALELNDQFEVIYFVDDDESLVGTNIAGVEVISGSELSILKEQGVTYLASEIANSGFRLSLRERVNQEGLCLINVIHPDTYISPSVTLGVGNFIKAGAMIGTNTVIEDCCIIDNNVTIPHDNVIEDGAHIAPDASLGSSIVVGEETIVGIGASISTGIKIGNSVIISVGSTATKDIPDNKIIEGVPGKVVGERKGEN